MVCGVSMSSSPCFSSLAFTGHFNIGVLGSVHVNDYSSSCSVFLAQLAEEASRVSFSVVSSAASFLLLLSILVAFLYGLALL